MVFLHNRSAYAAAGTARHLDKAVVNLSAFDILKCRNAVFHAVKRHVCIFGMVAGHGLQNSAGCREEARKAHIVVIHFLRDGYTLSVQPVGKLLKGQNCVNYSGVLLRLILLGNARTDKDGLRTGMTLLDVLTVRLHG